MSEKNQSFLNNTEERIVEGQGQTPDVKIEGRQNFF